MSPFFTFVYAVFGALCVWWLLSRARKKGGRPRLVTWIALLVWYVAVGMGLSFTLINCAGSHSRATLVGAIGTIIVAVVLGFVVCRFSSRISGRAA